MSIWKLPESFCSQITNTSFGFSLLVGRRVTGGRAVRVSPHSLRLWIENSKEDQLVEALLERYFSTQVAEVLRHTEVSKICLIYTYNMSNLCFGKYSDEKFLKFRCALCFQQLVSEPRFLHKFASLWSCYMHKFCDLNLSNAWIKFYREMAL